MYQGQDEIGSVNEHGELIEFRMLGMGKGAEIGAAVAIELQNRVFAPIHDLYGNVVSLIDMQTNEVASSLLLVNLFLFIIIGVIIAVILLQNNYLFVTIVY